MRRILALALTCGVLVAMPAAARGEDDTPSYPGLPKVTCTNEPAGFFCFDGFPRYSWFNGPQIGLASSRAAKQWVRTPTGMLALTVVFGGTGATEEVSQYGKLFLRSLFSLNAFFVSPPGSSQPYGDSPVIRTRTLAFGSIPVEAELQVSQERDAADDPRPLKLMIQSQQWGRRSESENTIDWLTLSPNRLRDNVNVKVRSLTVDGVDLDLRACETGSTALLDVSSQFEAVPYAGTDPGSRFDGTRSIYDLNGGALRGTIDIPVFRGCVSKTGDDVSRLVSSAISGPDNPLELRIQGPTCSQTNELTETFPAPPGVQGPGDPRANCSASGTSNPTLGQYLPPLVPYPDHAPGESDRE